MQIKRPMIRTPQRAVRKPAQAPPVMTSSEDQAAKIIEEDAQASGGNKLLSGYCPVLCHVISAENNAGASTVVANKIPLFLDNPQAFSYTAPANYTENTNWWTTVDKDNDGRLIYPISFGGISWFISSNVLTDEQVMLLYATASIEIWNNDKQVSRKIGLAGIFNTMAPVFRSGEDAATNVSWASGDGYHYTKLNRRVTFGSGKNENWSIALNLVDNTVTDLNTAVGAGSRWTLGFILHEAAVLRPSKDQ